MSDLDRPDPEIITETNDTKPDSIEDFAALEVPLPVSRRTAREFAVKGAYAIEMQGYSVDEALADPLVNEGLTPPPFTVELLRMMDSRRDRLDDIIRSKIERWEFHRVAIIDRLILRMATAELLYMPDVPPKVSINEAIEVAKKFSTENSGRFINGVLDAIYGDMGRGEKIPTVDGGFRIEA